MAASHGHGVLERPADQGPRSTETAWAAAVLVFVLAVAAAWRQGGFWRSDALVVILTSLGLLAATGRTAWRDRRARSVVAAVGLLASWWLARAVMEGTAASFLPLGGSMVAFAAAFAAVRALTGRAREAAGLALASLGAGLALVGFLGLAWRWYPLAMPSQGLWRLASTLTYADAAGAVLAVCLLVALACDRDPLLVRVAVCLTAGGVVATQSRGALLALACGLVFLPRRRCTQFAVPLVAGVGLGVAAVAASPGNAPRPWLGAALVLALVLAAASTSVEPSWIRRARYAKPVAATAAAAGLVAAVVLAHHEIALRALAPSDHDRIAEWSAAWHQWASAPLVGVGPDRLLEVHAADGSVAHFAHNEYLQVGADAGAVGLALLAFVGTSVAHAVRRFDVLAAGAVAALVCWAVAGGVDFDWHLPLVGLVGGWCAGLAAHRGPPGASDPEVPQAPSASSTGPGRAPST